MKKYVEIGHTKSAHGVKGSLKFRIEEQYFEDFSLAKRIFIEQRGTKLPYFVESFQVGNEVIVQLKNVTNRDQSHLLTSKKIFLLEKDILADEDRTVTVEAEPFVELIGYTLIEKTLGTIGEILEVREMPSQFMAILEIKEKVVFVPLVDLFILETNKKERTILMELPEGIFDL